MEKENMNGGVGTGAGSVSSLLSKDFISFLWFYVSFGLVSAVAFIVGRFVPTFQVSFPAYDVTGNCNPVTIQFSIRELVELFLIGPVFCTISWKANQALWASIPSDAPDREKKHLIDSLYLVGITIIVMGVALHGLANALHDMAKDMAGIPDQLFYSIYLWDEIISHYIIPTGFFGMLFLNAIIDSKRVTVDPELYVMAIIERRVTVLMGIGMAGMWTYSLIEGQAAWFFAIVSGISIAFIFLVNEVRIRSINKGNRSSNKKFIIKDNPYLLLTIVYSIVNIMLVIFWAILYGLKPCLPWLFEPSEGKPAWVLFVATLIIGLVSIPIMYKFL